MSLYEELGKAIQELDTAAGMLLVPAMEGVGVVREAMEKVIMVNVSLGELAEGLSE